MFVNNQQVTEEIKREIKKILESNDNENMTTLNLWDATKAVLRRKFIAIQSYFKKQDKHLMDNLSLHIKQLEKELHDDSLWYFLTNRTNARYQTRIDLILDLISQKPADNREKYYTFFKIDELGKTITLDRKSVV